jgi:protein ImuA
MLPGPLKAQTIQELRTHLGSVRLREKHTSISPGHDEWEELFAGRGFERGTFVEWLAESAGQGAETLSLILAGRVIRSWGGTLVVLDDQKTFYAPVAQALGMDPEAMVVLRPASEADSLWALEQSLRCPGVGAVIGRLDRLPDHGMQRLKRAAEVGGGVGFLLRSASVRRWPSWAEMRLLVRGVSCQSPGWRLRVEVLRSQRGESGKAVEVEIDHETGDVRPVPRVASPTAFVAKTGT